jgi:CspA family cold shock protein
MDNQSSEHETNMDNQSYENNNESENNLKYVKEDVGDAEHGDLLGNCKWFNKKLGYGFITVYQGEHKGVNIFVHHSGIKPLNSNFRTLRKGEYVSFDIEDGKNGLQAVNVSGVLGGPLMCDNHIQKYNHKK